MARAQGFELSQTGPVQMPMILFQDDPDLRLAMDFSSQMMQRGFYIIPLHNLFLCVAMTSTDISQTIDTASSVFEDMKRRRSLIEPHPVLARHLASSQKGPLNDQHERDGG